MRIADREVGPGNPVFIVAEIGASHCGEFNTAKSLVLSAERAGADAVKFQCYTPDSCAVDSDHPAYTLTKGPWAGKRLWDLYAESHMPWEWHEELFAYAIAGGLIPFSTPTDKAGIDFLETLDCPAYKIASHDIVYLELISHAASTGKPVILSTGMASANEILKAREVAMLAYGRGDVVTLHCTSAYPTPPAEANVSTMKIWTGATGLTGLSDHTEGHLAAQLAVAAGACIIEKHLGFEHLREKSHDGGFYANPEQFKRMVEAIREAEVVMGEAKYGPTDSESTEFRRRLCWAKDLPALHTVTRDDILVVCGADGLLANRLDDVIGTVAIDGAERHNPIRGLPSRKHAPA